MAMYIAASPVHPTGFYKNYRRRGHPVSILPQNAGSLVVAPRNSISYLSLSVIAKALFQGIAIPR